MLICFPSNNNIKFQIVNLIFYRRVIFYSPFLFPRQSLIGQKEKINLISRRGESELYLKSCETFFSSFAFASSVSSQNRKLNNRVFSSLHFKLRHVFIFVSSFKFQVQKSRMNEIEPFKLIPADPISILRAFSRIHC